MGGQQACMGGQQACMGGQQACMGGQQACMGVVHTTVNNQAPSDLTTFSITHPLLQIDLITIPN